MSDASSTIAPVIGGIQDIAALLPLLGTEQCEEHVGSALLGGYLYAAASPMSIFGSIGVARAGIKALVASISIPSWGFFGAEKLGDAGFKPSGKSLSLILMDEANPKRYLAETRFDSLLSASHIENLRVEDLGRIKFNVAATDTWNRKLLFWTAIFAFMGLAPYVHLNIHNNLLAPRVRWAFPLVRIIGTYLTATFIQIVIQRRLLVILKKRLIFHALRNGSSSESLESELPDHWNLQTSAEQGLSRLYRIKVPTKAEALHPDIDDFAEDSHRARGRLVIEAKNELAEACTKIPVDITIWDLVTYLLLALGLIGTIGGYLLSFIVVQRANPTSNPLGPISWVILEAFLSLTRIWVWGSNPGQDDLDPFDFSIELDSTPPFPTCTETRDVIQQYKILPLIPAADFLGSIRFFTGHLEDFSSDNSSVFYTLTRTFSMSEIHALFITVVDHALNRTVVYYEDSVGHILLAAETPVGINAMAHSNFTVRIHNPVDFEYFPMFNVPGRFRLLKTHYNVIWDKLNRTRPQQVLVDTVGVDWDITFTRKPFVRPLEQRMDTGWWGPPSEADSIKYLRFGELQRERQRRFLQRPHWLAAYMAELDMLVQSRIDTWYACNKTEIPHHTLSELRTCALMLEFFNTECLFVYEFRLWENRLRQEQRHLINCITVQRAFSHGKVLEQRLNDVWASDALKRLRTSESLAVDRIKRTGHGFFGGAPVETPQKAMWRNLELALKAQWNLLLEEADRVVVQPLHPYTPSRHQVQLQSQEPQVRAFWDFLVCEMESRILDERKDVERATRSTVPETTTPWSPTENYIMLMRDPRAALCPDKWFVLHAFQLDKHITTRPNPFTHAIQCNTHLAFLQFESADLQDQELADAIRALVPTFPVSLTSLAVRQVPMPGQDVHRSGAQVDAALRECQGLEAVFVGSPEHHLSVFSPPPGEVMVQPEVGHASYAFHGLWIQQSNSSRETRLRNYERAEAHLSVRFRTPAPEDDLVLALRHRLYRPVEAGRREENTYGDSDQGNIHLYINGTCIARPSQVVHGEWALIDLHTSSPFVAGALCEITVQIPAGCVYELYGIELLGPHYVPYRTGPTARALPKVNIAPAGRDDEPEGQRAIVRVAAPAHPVSRQVPFRARGLPALASNLIKNIGRHSRRS